MALRVLALMGLGDKGVCGLQRAADGSIKPWLRANVALTPALAPLGTVDEMVLGVPGSLDVKVRTPDVIFNLICNCEAAGLALSQAGEVVAALQRPVINAPAAVARTGRQAMAQRIAAHPGLRAAPVQVLQPRRLVDLIAAWRRGELPADFLIRPADTHGGDGMYRVRALADFDVLERYALDGQPYLVMPYIDYQSPDGLYRKYRVLSIDGKLMPRHMIAAPDWMIHSESRRALMPTSLPLQEEEQRFLADPAAVLGRSGWQALRGFAADVGLDFFGMDMALLPDGTPLIFECNACMNVLAAGAGDGFAYLDPVVTSVSEAIVAMVDQRVASR